MEIAAFEQFAYQNAEPDFYLIHPGSVLGCKVQHDLVGGVVQKRRAAFHRLQNAAFAFDSQRLWCYCFPLSNPAHQRFGLMDVQIIQHTVPPGRLLITGDEALKMREGILLGACWSPGRLDDVPGDDIKIDEPGQGAMSDILEFTPQHMTGLHGQVGMLALGGLHAGSFVHADGAFSALGPLWSLGIHLTSLHNLFVSVLIGNGC